MVYTIIILLNLEKWCVTMKKTWDSSDSLWLALMLSFSGGLMDAYSYLQRGKVFANAQTGNILLFSINLTTGNYSQSLHFIFPVIAFSLGIACASMLRLYFQNKPHVHWRQIVVIIEAIIFFTVAFLPQSTNLLANNLISFACGAQVESFRKIQNHASGFATTMCIGNLRTSVACLCEYHKTKNKKTLNRSIAGFLIILAFAVGTIGGNFFITLWSEKAIIISGILMLVAFIAMLTNERAEIEQEIEQIIKKI